MPTRESVLRAHDHLLAGGQHADCSICHQGDGNEQSKEVARVADEPKYSEAQLAALVADGVQRETSALTAATSTLEAQVASLTDETTSLQTKVDLLEAEKAAAVEATAAVQQEFDDFKAALAAEKAMTDRIAERVERIIAAAPALPESYTADEARRTRWGAMPDEAFDSLLDGLIETAKMSMPSSAPKGVKQEDWEGMSMPDKMAWMRKNSEKSSEKGPSSAELRETAAFTGGKKPSSTGADGTSRLSQFLTATGKGPKTTASA